MTSNKKLRVVVLEDEPLLREELCAALHADGRVDVVANAAHPNALTAATEIDGAFFDIRVPGADGLHVAKEWLARDPDLGIVMVTAYADDAVRSYDVGALDYLLKPLDDRRLSKAIDRLCEHVALTRMEQQPTAEATFDANEPTRTYLERFAVKKRGNLIVVATEDVAYFEVKDELVWAITPTERVSLDLPLSQLETRLDPAHFFRSHRGFIVALQAIAALEPTGAGTFDIVLRAPLQGRVPLAREKARVLREKIPILG